MTEPFQPRKLLDLLDWKRRVFAVYAEIRAADDPQAAWRRWRDVRDELIRAHPQSPIADPAVRERFPGASYFDYDPAFRVTAEVAPTEPERIVIPASADGEYAFTRFAEAKFELGGVPQALSLFWLEGYGGGLFLSFRDTTSGKETYGACRYLLDTVKGADLGTDGGRLVLDFNFAYNPSCSYDPRWVCPLAPPENRLEVAVRAGERYEKAEGPAGAGPSGSP
ncbi:MAG TPA: DUF1684 domain-containing protein [Actinomycetota bacterium]|nr:DUF1684 domain-containing protein [Actinomycetota bacterium]